MSINLVVATSKRVVACADSRASNSDGSPANDAGAQKIFQAGDRSVFGYAGIGVLKDFSPTGDQLDNPRKLLMDLSAAYHGPFVAALATETAFLKRIMAGTPVVFSAWCLTRKQSGEIELAELKFPLRDGGDGTPHLAEPEVIVGTVMPNPRLVFCNPPDPAVDPFTVTVLKHADGINPDLDDAEILRDVDRVFRTAIHHDSACRKHIGGTIVVAVIDADFRWLRKAG